MSARARDELEDEEVLGDAPVNSRDELRGGSRLVSSDEGDGREAPSPGAIPPAHCRQDSAHHALQVAHK